MPILELEPPIAHYGNYYDSIMSGSFGLGNSRGYAGSRVGGNFLYYSAKFVSDYYTLLRNKNPGSFSRNIKFFSTETIYSSIVPNIFEMFEINGGKYIKSNLDISDFSTLGTEKAVKMYFGSHDAFVTGSDFSQISDNLFLGSNPFQKEYYSVRRLVADNLPTRPIIYDLENFSGGSVVVQKNTITDEGSNKYYFGYVTSGSNVIKRNMIVDSRGSVEPSGIFVLSTIDAMQKEQMFKFLFGYKPYFRDEYGGNISQQRYYFFGLNIRGWKYGISNISKIKTSAVFRSNHFGHFRDMLEQRQYTKVLVEKTNTIKIPIEISFVSGSEAASIAYNPVKQSDSAIFDTEYRSTAPWVDV